MHNNADIPCEVTVAIAEPTIPNLKTTTKTMHKIALRIHEIIKKTNGVFESPMDRSANESHRKPPLLEEYNLERTSSQV